MDVNYATRNKTDVISTPDNKFQFDISILPDYCFKTNCNLKVSITLYTTMQMYINVVVIADVL